MVQVRISIEYGTCIEIIGLSRSRARHGIAKAQTVSYMYLLILLVLLRPRVKHGDKIVHI